LKKLSLKETQFKEILKIFNTKFDFFKNEKLKVAFERTPVNKCKKKKNFVKNALKILQQINEHVIERKAS
jgi:hypothetical protein